MLLHEFAHVDANHRRRIVEQESGERLRQLGLANARRAEEQERTERPVGVLQSGTRSTHRSRNSGDGGVLTDNRFSEDRLHLEELFALALEHLVDGNAGPAADDAGDVVRGHLFAQHGACRGTLCFDKLPFERGNRAILELTCPAQVTRALCLIKRNACRFELFLQLGLGLNLFLLALPAGGQRG